MRLRKTLSKIASYEVSFSLGELGILLHVCISFLAGNRDTGSISACPLTEGKNVALTMWALLGQRAFELGRYTALEVSIFIS